jgi:hypothetical protein
MGISLSFHSNMIHDREFFGSVVSISSSSHFPSYYSSSPYLCFFSLANDTHMLCEHVFVPMQV